MNKLNNSIRLTGFLGSMPSVTLTPNNQKVVRATLATNEKRKLASGNKAVVTHWHHLVFSGPQAELAEQHLKTGVQLSIRGLLVKRCYVDKQGKKKKIDEVLVGSLLTAGMNQTSLFA
jgi:single-strand DNA-binding protein